MVEKQSESLFYSAEEVRKMFGLGRTKGYAFLDKVMAAGKPFNVVKMDKLYKIPKESFDSWIQRLNKNVES